MARAGFVTMAVSIGGLGSKVTVSSDGGYGHIHRKLRA